jgi:hypothetical protein
MSPDTNKQVEQVVISVTSSAMANNAADKKEGASAAMNGFKLMLLALMVLQNSATVLVGRYTRSNAPKDDLFIVNHLVLVTELAKVNVECNECYECMVIEVQH